MSEQLGENKNQVGVWANRFSAGFLIHHFHCFDHRFRSNNMMKRSSRLPRWSLCTRISVVLFVAAASISSTSDNFVSGKSEGAELKEGVPWNTMRVGEHTWGRRDLAPALSITQEELDFCVANLEFVAIDGQVGEDEFILFLQKFSPEPLSFDEFHELPLQLVLVFYTAACTGGRNCSTQKPKISLADQGVSMAFLHVFCTSVKEVAMVEISFKFQYQIQLAGSEDDVPLMNSGSTQTNNERELIHHLEHATELALLTDLGCVGEGEFGSSRMLRDAIGHWRAESPTVAPDQVPSANGDDSEGKETTRNNVNIFHHRQRDPSQQVDCGYSVHASVYRWHEMPCLPVPTRVAVTEGGIHDTDENVACLLMFSEVRLTAAWRFQELTRPELRSAVSSTLKTAILGKEFDKYLAAQTLNPS